jgi:hypothetical protein
MSVTTSKFFYVGETYRAKKSFTVGSSFREGELLIFTGGGFSPHDNAHFYEFRSLADESSKAWVLGEDDPLSLREEYFERILA